ncbi:MAG TPA: protein kinase [Burkholderiaceae bacterium]|nr:protein kinase [Burkholderiaceae bacterium]
MALTADQVALLKHLLDQALPLDVNGRQRWLRNLSPEHQALAPALREALLSEDTQSGVAVLATAPENDGTDDAVTVPSAGLRAGQRIGPYQLVRELGAGGMAVVWLARRDGREVALKLPLMSRLRRDLAERFARECEILARLEHPNIARMYEAGISDDGLPYLALEYVEGLPLTTWCDTHQFGVRERLKLFQQVLDAVQYAHERQVVHRDLKPSNLLVTQWGQVRLLDFGVAKMLADGQVVLQTDLTRVYGRMLTPDYASPEQLQNNRIGAASDIYALGVVLYELLVGNRPYRIKVDPSVMPLEQAIRDAQIRKPSTQVQEAAAAARATSREKLMRRLRGDLDNIVLKALAKQPEARYSSVASFAADVQRYLNGDPVEARSDRLGPRTDRFLVSHPFATATVVTLIAAAIELTMTYRIDWVAALHRATEKIGAWSAAVLPAPERAIAVVPFTDLSEARDQAYFSEGLSDELADRLARIADLRVIARTSSSRFKGKSDDARPIAEQLGVAGVLSGDVRRTGSSIRVSARLIRGSDGSSLWTQTFDREATDVFKLHDEISSAVARALHAPLMQDPPPNPASERNFDAYDAFLRGAYFSRRPSQEDLPESIAAYQEAVRLDPQYARGWAELARAFVHQGRGQPDAVESAYAKAKEAIAHALAIDPKQPVAHAMLGYVYWDYDLNRDAGRAEFEKAHELDPSDADVLAALTTVAVARGRLDEAIDFERRNVAADPLNAPTLGELGNLYRNAGRLVESEQALRRALAIDATLGGGHCDLGLTLVARGQPEPALDAMRRETDQAARVGCLPIALWALGRHAEADAALASLIDRYPDSRAYGIAQALAFEAKNDAAFEWLERAWRQRNAALAMIKVDYFLHGLRGDPRLDALLAKMKLPQ